VILKVEILWLKSRRHLIGVDRLAWLQARVWLHILRWAWWPGLDGLRGAGPSLLARVVRWKPGLWLSLGLVWGALWARVSWGACRVTLWGGPRVRRISSRHPKRSRHPEGAESRKLCLHTTLRCYSPTFCTLVPGLARLTSFGQPVPSWVEEGGSGGGDTPA